VLKTRELNLYIYVVARDFGFAPNPFHGYCTLATCKPGIRKGASIGDWVMGVGGSRLSATGKCIYLMKVTEKLNFNEYWQDERFQMKKPCRNGSNTMMLGDNIYHKENDIWIQEDSHHSLLDGTVNQTNLERDTKSDKVLTSNHYYYFGCEPIDVDLKSINYTNSRGYRKKPLNDSFVMAIIRNVEINCPDLLNIVKADPFQFQHAAKRVDQGTNKIT